MLKRYKRDPFLFVCTCAITLGMLLFLVRCAWGQERTIPEKDLKVFLELAKEKKCLLSTQPEFELSPLTLVTDRDGRTFVQDGATHPYRIKLTWCPYTVEGQGTLKVVAARMVPKAYGFRFRPKAYMGFLPTETEDKLLDGVDLGLLLDFWHYSWFNVNAGVGIRSTTAGLGVDLTTNFGIYAGVSYTWTRHLTPTGSFYFSF